MNRKLFDCLPILSLFGYWVYACLISALMTDDPRMLAIGFVSAPAVLAMGAAAVRIARSGPGR